MCVSAFLCEETPNSGKQPAMKRPAAAQSNWLVKAETKPVQNAPSKNADDDAPDGTIDDRH